MLITLRPALLPLAACAMLCACAVTQVAPPDAGPAPAQFKESATTDIAAQPVPDPWWSLFQDPVLDDLERRVVIGNESIKSSMAQLAGAQAVLAASHSANGPTLSAGLNATRTATAQTSAAENPSNSVALTATAGWEVDLWGRLSMATQGAQSSLNASQADLAAARLSVQAAVAQNYFSLRAAEAQQALLERNVQAYRRALELTHARYISGVAGLSDVLQAQTQLSSVQTQLADTQAQRAQLEHTIAVLLGSAPSAFAITPTAALPAVVAVPNVLPSTLLERRPDIAAARERVKAAYAQIGVSDAALFPTLNLSATAGYGQSSIANLLSTPNLLWSLGVSVTQSVLDGGSRKLASAQARAAADQVTSSYRQLVLTALQEVEDNLVLNNRLAEELQSQTLSLQAAQRNLDIVMAQYRAGTVSYLTVSSAQSAALSSEATLVSVRSRQLITINTLLKNIAGRWDRM